MDSNNYFFWWGRGGGESGMYSPQTLPLDLTLGRVTERETNPVKIRLKSVESMS